MPFFVCLFWSVIIATDLIKGNCQKHRFYLLAFYISATLLYFGHGVFFNHNIELMPLSDWLYSTCNLAVYPLWYLYICITTQRHFPKTEQTIILLPTIIGSLALGILYTLMSHDDVRLFTEEYLYENHHNNLIGFAKIQAKVHSACKVIFAMQIPPVLYYGYIRVKKFNSYVSSIYSNIEGKALPESIPTLLILFLMTSIASFTANIIGREVFDDSILLLAIPSIGFSALLFCIGYVCYFHTFSIENIETDEQEADRQAQADENIQYSELRLRIENCMTGNKLYLRPDLKLQDLVVYVNSNRNYVHNAINKEMGISFNEYVNRLRIKHAEQLLLKDVNTPMSEVAEKSGFTSIATFYRNFRMYNGKSPKEFQQNQ